MKCSWLIIFINLFLINSLCFCHIYKINDNNIKVADFIKVLLTKQTNCVHIITVDEKIKNVGTNNSYNQLKQETQIKINLNMILQRLQNNLITKQHLLSYIIINYNFIIKQNIRFFKLNLCDYYIIFINENSYLIDNLFIPFEMNTRFYPFTTLFIVMDDNNRDSILDKLKLYKNYMLLNVFLINFDNFSMVYNVLESKILLVNESNVVSHVFKENSKHPLFINETKFRISLFNCPPFVLRLPQANGSYKYGLIIIIYYFFISIK